MKNLYEPQDVSRNHIPLSRSCRESGNNHPSETIFRPGVNCWTTGEATKASLLIDCANYYKALYESIRKARHSIFILGWDIDGRIELLRGQDAKTSEESITLFSLICEVATSNPDLKIYLNRWNYSIFFTKEREPFSGLKWHFSAPSNVFYCADYTVPLGACHHQKVIVIDDQIAFCGGMDIALGRWDRRQHHIHVRDRVDPAGLWSLFRRKPYEPYHDIQFMVEGPVVKVLSSLVRERWRKGAGFEAVPVNPENPDSLWPLHVKADFENAKVAVARTLPRTSKTDSVREVEAMYLSLIALAHKFIYIENQYLTCRRIAQALNNRLHECPDLRVLVVSCDHPRGYMEHKAMWTGRVLFNDISSAGVAPGRLEMVYPACKENGIENTIHIHSKLMIVDDRFMQVGSANLNSRSMGFDTECDMIVEATSAASRQRIASLRNDLIREHTGRDVDDIARLISQSDLRALLEHQPHSRQHLYKVDHDPYRDDFLAGAARKLGDPDEAYFLLSLPVRQILFWIGMAGLAVLLFWSWLDPLFSDFFSQENLVGAIERARGSNLSILPVVMIYILAGVVLFPVTILNLTTAVVFGPEWGILMALAGCAASASLSYGAGRILGQRAFGLFRPVAERIKFHSQRGGLLGMTIVRLVPIAPFTLVNLTFGFSRVPFLSYIAATILGLLPGIVVKALFGGALGQLWTNPQPRVVFFAAGCLFLWGLLIWASQRFIKHYYQKGLPG